jgi:hypothetical protein
LVQGSYYAGENVGGSMKVELGGKTYDFEVTVGTIRLYRKLLNKDILIENEIIEKVKEKVKRATLESEMYENLTYVLCYQSDDTIGTLEEFFSTISVKEFAKAEVAAVECWIASVYTIEEDKKK